jgi:hypothetical protein
VAASDVAGGTAVSANRAPRNQLAGMAAAGVAAAADRNRASGLASFYRPALATLLPAAGVRHNARRV